MASTIHRPVSPSDALGLHFKTLGRTIYLADQLAALCAGETPFSPDILAVLDVEPTEGDERLAWEALSTQKQASS